MSATTNDPSSLSNGQMFGRYRIVRKLGQGGMGAVYEAVHPELKKRVAIKTLLPSLAAIPEARSRFLREGEAAARVRHPHVVDVADVGAVDDTPFLVMEYLEGESLADHIHRRGALPVEEALDILLPAAAAVAAGHAVGVIHRDLKPHNIFLARAGGRQVTKVLDFGVSKLVGEGATMNLTSTSSVLGTMTYMSPEQAEGAKLVDPRTDQYALGLILFECLTGRAAHQGDNPVAVVRSIADGRHPRPRDLKPDLPEELEDVVLRAMALRQADRFESVTQFGKALLPWCGARAQMLWGDLFDQAPAPEPPAAEAPPTPSGLNATVALPESGASGGGFREQASTSVLTNPPSAGTSESERGTKLLPQVNDAPSSGTLSRTNGEQITARTAKVDRKRRTLAVGLGAAGTVVAVGLVVALSSGERKQTAAPTPAPPEPPRLVESPPPPTPPVPPATVEVEPRSALIELDGRSLGVGRAAVDIEDGTKHTLRISAAGYAPRTIEVGNRTDLPARVSLEPEPTPDRKPTRAETTSKPRPKATVGRAAAPPEKAPAPAPAAPVTKQGTNAAPILR